MFAPVFDEFYRSAIILADLDRPIELRIFHKVAAYRDVGQKREIDEETSS